MLRISGHALENCSIFLEVALVQSKIAKCYHWKLKPSACPKKASMQAVTLQAFPVLFLSGLKKHPINSVFYFHDPLSGEYLAFLHDLCNTGVWYFFLESFATKAVVIMLA